MESIRGRALQLFVQNRTGVVVPAARRGRLCQVGVHPPEVVRVVSLDEFEAMRVQAVLLGDLDQALPVQLDVVLDAGGVAVPRFVAARTSLIDAERHLSDRVAFAALMGGDEQSPTRTDIDMNGHNHALAALTAYAGGMAVGHSTFGLALPPTATLVFGGAMALGVGLAPDIDEKHSIASQGAGVFGAATRAITSAFGGHRSITHSPIPVTIALTVLSAAMIAGDVGPHGLGVAAGIAVALGVPFLLGPKRRSRLGFLLDVVVIVVGVATYYAADRMGVTPGWWLYASLPVSYLSHVLGDSITPAGVPWLWPVSKVKVGVGLMESGGRVENSVVTPVLTLAAISAWVWLVSMSSPERPFGM